jgi:hypothetical protein
MIYLWLHLIGDVKYRLAPTQWYYIGTGNSNSLYFKSIDHPKSTWTAVSNFELKIIIPNRRFKSSRV